eukprot:74891-Chlamydomonas_euryale.AAC.5
MFQIHVSASYRYYNVNIKLRSKLAQASKCFDPAGLGFPARLSNKRVSQVIDRTSLSASRTWARRQPPKAGTCVWPALCTPLSTCSNPEAQCGLRVAHTASHSWARRQPPQAAASLKCSYAPK